MKSKLVPVVALLVIVAGVVAALLLMRRETVAESAGPDAAAIAENNRGCGLMGQYDYEPARAIFQTLVDRYPVWLDARVNLAIATLNRQQEGDEQTALGLVEAVLAEEPGHRRARYVRGLLQLYLGSPGAALEDFRFVAEADPGDAYAAYHVGQSLAQERRPEEAATWYGRAIEIDPYLRSAYYGLSQAHQRLGAEAEARSMLEAFERLKDNPRGRLVAFTYAQMGPSARAVAVDAADARPQPRPEGPVFGAPEPLMSDGSRLPWRVRSGAGITACDVDGNGALDLLLNAALDGAAPNALLLDDGAGGFRAALDHPLAAVTSVRAALWGDVDNDGLTDVYLCREGPNQLWRQVEPGRWEDVTSATGTGGAAARTVAGVMVDADHDGDLDIFCVNANAPNELFSNNLDGTFRPLAAERGIGGTGHPSRQAVFADLDGDRDLDLVVVHDQPPHEAWMNDRLWAYRPAEGFDELLAAPIGVLVAGDVDADGRVELYATTRSGVVAWSRDDSGDWQASAPGGAGATATGAAGLGLALEDLDGDGAPDLLVSSRAGWTAWRIGPRGATEQIEAIASGVTPQVAWRGVLLDASRGPAVVGLPIEGQPLIWRPGPGRHAFMGLELTGMEDVGQSMRSNASGLGAEVVVRVGSRWTAFSTLPAVAQPGQSLQPIAVGLGGAAAADFIAIEWSDGVFQSELTLGSGVVHRVPETQRQLSSCPVLFAWDGSGFRFVTDLLGVGGLGFAVAPGEYAPARPWEHLLLPEGAAAPRDGRYELRLGEPMEEACYLDAARLVAYDLPPGWRMTIDERMSIAGPEPTGDPIFYSVLAAPRRVTNDRGDDVTAALRDADRVAAPVGPLDTRFIGRLREEHVLTLELDEPIGAGDGVPVLLVDGWIEYPYSQTMFAAWQAGASYEAPTLEARGADGRWVALLEQFGYPAGMPREMSVPLRGLPGGTTALRLRTNQEIYWDRIAIVLGEPCPEAGRRPLELETAEVRRSGFARRTTGAQRLPHYDYERRTPSWDTRHQSGHYTAFGPVTDLVREADDALAIFGPGEEVRLVFAACDEALAPGWTRRLVLEAEGWCKDMDLFTRDGETIEPLPTAGRGSPRREDLHRLHNTRYESGR